MNHTIHIIPTEEFTDVTDQINEYISFDRVADGICIIYSKHTTACIRVLESETLLKQDMHDFFERLAPSNCVYRHDNILERDVPPTERCNGFSHLRAMLLNHQEIIPIVNGKLDLGKWQRVFFIECDFGSPIREDRFINMQIRGD